MYTHVHKWLPEIKKTMFTPPSTFTPVRSVDSSLRDCVVREMQTVGVYWVNPSDSPQIIYMNEQTLPRPPPLRSLSLLVAWGGVNFCLFTSGSHLCNFVYTVTHGCAKVAHCVTAGWRNFSHYCQYDVSFTCSERREALTAAPTADGVHKQAFTVQGRSA